MFNKLTAMPADPILGLLTKYREDPHSQKVDLGVGVYKDEAGHTPILTCVKKAEKFRLDTESTKVYIGPTGSADFNQLMSELAFGSDHPALLANRVRTVSTPGGTGALRVAADFIKRCNPNATLWVSDPTWANHTGLFEAAGITVKTYPYYDYDNKTLKFDEMKTALSSIGADDVVLLHACCHNPSGMDLTNEQWDEIIAISANQGFTPLIDMAYQGFGVGVDEDAYGVRNMAAAVDTMILCSSCSKNFGLYRERIGACTIIGKDAARSDIAFSVLLYVVRCIYSMPPAHGAAIVETILGSETLKQEWLAELTEMRERINGNRAMLVAKLKEKGVQQNFDFIAEQKGMFSFLGITPDQVAELQQHYSVYMVDSSRISIAGIGHGNVDYLAESIAKVIC
ncbi:amino acid aminotransferase [Shewanella fidelis]|uniref:Aminotransferase n=1 Tax=Shewanella fidelis TaxID=173509 RepID=A0AAW8NLM9_9GAMM|nr:amino acid aminotransferase [Shewanella fidelis]MDR8523762.1 aspartate/tyrosine/aromatic aminotransferase [Shewanella fidelis]MDW4810310.1 aspartate/tyrosine/aromatic aminotransferase [Shewanella fidelis]MDW4814455.1 aspartate/tyrosine/aromatic aminotransferase [Shewanella fidelis]MDW4818545.1 aspartate/tyrosine/aromatic aminotransferase [Shewanella fidelis]MDW4823802.1 aspartate/tyrosine/aromatic aminotransferase [Shewanella fidelis]